MIAQMIESIMYFGVRLTMRRLEATIPPSMAELQADVRLDSRFRFRDCGTVHCATPTSETGREGFEPLVRQLTLPVCLAAISYDPHVTRK